MKFERIRICGLFGQSDHEFSLEGEPTFLVGPNGSGKTTLLKAFFFTCTGQWEKLSSLPIASVEFASGDMAITLDQSDFQQMIRVERLLQPYFRRVTGPLRHLWPNDWEVVERHLKMNRSLDRTSPAFLERLEIEYEYLAEVQNFVIQASVRARGVISGGD
ncbi:MAG: AAA family ATPase [Erythrobacter sp.]